MFALPLGPHQRVVSLSSVARMRVEERWMRDADAEIRIVLVRCTGEADADPEGRREHGASTEIDLGAERRAVISGEGGGFAEQFPLEDRAVARFSRDREAQVDVDPPAGEQPYALTG